MRTFVLPAICGLSLVLLSACDQTEPAEKETPLRVNAAIAAVVNGEYILASEVELEAAAQGRLDEGERLEVDDPNFEEILEQLIDQKLLAQETLARGLDQEESARHRLHAARERILGNILVERLVSEEVDDAAILKMYQAQVELQQLGEEVLIRHIQVSTQEEADRLYQQLKNGAEFAELAFTHSTHRDSSAEGGLIGYVLPEEMSEEFTDVINRTAVGQFSKPFESEIGWHILKVDDRRKEKPPSLDEIRPKIVQYLTLSEISRTLKRLRTRATIETITGSDPITVFEEPSLEDVIGIEGEEDSVDASENSVDAPAETIEEPIVTDDEENQ